MDVITVLRPENGFAGNRRPAPGRIARVAPRFGEKALAFEVPFPFWVLVAMAAAFALVTPLQSKFGLYRLERISFGVEDSLSLAFDAVLSPSSGAQNWAAPGAVAGPEASLADTETMIAVPESLLPVSWERYTVRAGDSVSRIASRFELRNVSTVLAVNGIDNARRLRVGQVLDIPSMDGLAHTVSRGDTLSSLSSRYSVAVTAILDVNDLATESLTIGQRLFIPGATLSRFDLKKAMGELFIRPVAGRLTSPYGYRSDPFTGARTFHTGIDLAVSLGTPIKATLDGKVAATGYSPVYGNYVIITHDGGYQSLYGHMQSIGVRKGASVLQGSIIGKTGSTGYSTGPHVHFSVYKNGKMINPLSVLE